MMNNTKSFISGALAVLVIVLSVTVYNLNSKVNELSERLVTEKVIIKHKSSPDEMFSKFFDLVVKLKEMELEDAQGRSRMDDDRPNSSISNN
jgi:hypothetical protein